MKAMVLHAPNAPFSLEERPDPVPGRGEAVARVFACGAGLTIEHIRAGRAPATFPRIIGHEISAEIVAVGPDVNELAIGDPVTCYFYSSCGHCRWCRENRETICENQGPRVGYFIDGGYAELIKLPVKNFLKLPPGLDHRGKAAEVAVIADALATPYKVNRRTRTRPGETVAVFGAGGGLGIHQIMLSKWAGARVIAVDTAAEKFDACRTAGAAEVVHAARDNVVEALRDLTRGKGVDVAIDYVSATVTLEQAVQSLAVKGRMVTLGGAGQVFRADALQMLRKELDLLGSRYVTRAEIFETLDLVARGEVWPMVTDIRPMAEAEALHERVEQGAVTGRAALLIGP